MLRLHAACLLAELLVALNLTAAPVPKQRPPEGLTAEQVVGTWHYESNGLNDGVITFDRNGSYVAVHVPGSDNVYAGTWKCDATSVTITEWLYSAATGAMQAGPTDYRFEFGAGAKLPELVGKSNGSVHVKLTRAKEGR
jgi:hypothetical protein